MEQKIVSVSSYGLFCMSPDIFGEFLQANKVRTANINKYFDKHRDLLEQSMMKGAWLPVATIDSIDYAVSIGSEPLFHEKGWESVLRLPGCNLTISRAGVWIGSLGAVSNWNPDDFFDKEYLSYKTLDGELCFRAFRFLVEAGMYKVELVGYKRKTPKDYPSVNYAYHFNLKLIDEFKEFTNPLTEDVNIADM